jgi:hypothetical protein
MRRLALVTLSFLGACASERAPVRISIARGTESRQVELGALPSAALGVRVSDVVKRAWPTLDDTSIAADFIAGDGFRPAARSPCLGLVPVSGTLLKQGYLDPDTGDLGWDDSLAFPGCLHVKGVATIVVLDRQTQGAKVKVASADATVDVDLSLLPTVSVGNTRMVALDVVVSSSGVVAAPHLFDYDFEDAKGVRPTASVKTPLTWSQLTKGWIEPASRDLAWDTALALPQAWSLRDTAIIHLIKKEVAAGHVQVVHGSNQADVDLGKLPVVPVGSGQLVVIQAVVNAASLVANPAGFSYDFECSDGYTIISGHADRKPLTWSDLGLGWIDPVSRNVSWDASLGFGSPWSARDVSIVHILDPG